MLYHCDIFLPASLKLPTGAYLLKYGPHAQQAAKSDRYGNLTPLLPAYIDCSKATVIEVETNGNVIVKIVYRQKLNEKKDICLAVCPTRHGTWFVKTVWSNVNGDTHLTLDKKRYTIS